MQSPPLTCQQTTPRNCTMGSFYEQPCPRLTGRLSVSTIRAGSAASAEAADACFNSGECALPTYDYRCPNCAHVFELRQSFHSEPVADCPKCNHKSGRLFHSPAIIYKGSGFYTTDYKNNHASSPDYSKDSSSKAEDSSNSEAAEISKEKSPTESSAADSN